MSSRERGIPTVLGIGLWIGLSLLVHPAPISALEFYRAKDDAVAYAHPSTDAPVLYRFKAGEEFKVIGKEGTWLQVRFSTKTTGYVREAEANQSISSEKVQLTVAQKNHPAPHPQPENVLSNEQSNPVQPEKKPQPPAPKVRVTALQLYQEYEENEVAADEKYKDKILEIPGVVDSVQKNDFGAIVVLLQGKVGAIVSHVQCSLADTGIYGGKQKTDNTQRAATLRRGQQVILKGEGRGRYGLDIAVIDCVFSGENPSFSSLAKWAGRYPTVDSKKGKTFFQEPALVPYFQKLSRADYQLLFSDYGVEAPIQNLDGYLFMWKCKPHACNFENVVVVVGLENGDFFTIFWNKDGDQASKVRCFANKSSLQNLPLTIKGELVSSWDSISEDAAFLYRLLEQEACAMTE
ncbi:MAG: SH3 domain-containing protein [Candidatus Binatia bacterium]